MPVERGEGGPYEWRFEDRRSCRGSLGILGALGAYHDRRKGGAEALLAALSAAFHRLGFEIRRIAVRSKDPIHSSSIDAGYA